MRQRLRAVLAQANCHIKNALKEIEGRADKLIFVPIIVYAVFFSAYMCYMHYVFNTFAWDLGIITQSLWTTLNSGKILYSTLEVPYGNPTGIFLGVHFSPILFLILPIYALYQSPQTLLVFQSFILAIAALPLYWLARDKLNSKLYGLAFAVTYLLNPALHGVNTFDFHLEIFTPAFILFAFYYLDKGKWYKALPFIVLELTTIEFAPFLVFPLGLYFFLRRLKETRKTKLSRSTSAKRLLFPIAIMIGSILALYLSFLVIELINPLKTGGAPGRWDYWGTNALEVVTNIIRNPWEALIVFVTPIEKPYFVIFVFASVLFLPMFAPIELLLAGPWIIAALLTDYPPYYQPIYQYSAFMLGQISIAAVYGFRKLFSSSTNQTHEHTVTRNKIITTMLLLNVLMFLAISPVAIPDFTSRGMRPYAFSTSAEINHVEELHKVLNLIPANASVAATQEIFPHVCERLNAYFVKWPLDYDVDYIVADVKSPFFTWGIYGPTPYQIVTTLMENDEYGVLASSDGVLLLKRGYTEPLQYYSPQKDFFDYEQLIPGVGKIIWDYASTSGKIITSDPSDSAGMIWFGPYKYFVQGTYSAIFKIETANKTCQLVLQVTTDQGSVLIAQETIQGTSFSQLDTWQQFSVPFNINLPTRLEFRGLCLSNNTQVAIDFIRVEQQAP